MGSSTQSSKDLLQLTIRKDLFETVAKLQLKTENQLESTIYWPESGWIANFSLFRPKPRAGPVSAVQDVPSTDSPAGTGTLHPWHTHRPVRGQLLHVSDRKSGLNQRSKGQLLREGQYSTAVPVLILMPFSSPPVTSRSGDFMAQPSYQCFLVLALDKC